MDRGLDIDFSSKCLTAQVAGQNVTGQNVTDKMLWGQNVSGQNVADKMPWTKCRGQNAVDKMPWTIYCGENVVEKMSRTEGRGQYVVGYTMFVILYLFLQANPTIQSSIGQINRVTRGPHLLLHVVLTVYKCTYSITNPITINAQNASFRSKGEKVRERRQQWKADGKI